MDLHLRHRPPRQFWLGVLYRVWRTSIQILYSPDTSQALAQAVLLENSACDTPRGVGFCDAGESRHADRNTKSASRSHSLGVYGLRSARRFTPSPAVNSTPARSRVCRTASWFNRISRVVPVSKPASARFDTPDCRDSSSRVIDSRARAARHCAGVGIIAPSWHAPKVCRNTTRTSLHQSCGNAF
jgi:hypothetical protein